MAIIYGVKATGKNGVLDHSELTDMLHRRSNGRANKKNCGVCATYIEDMNGADEGGGITTQFAGRTVYHISSGQRGGSDGCSTFFTLSADQGEVIVAGIVAVGWHDGGDTIYRLDWGKGPPFFSGNRFDSTKQHQRGYSDD